MVVYILCLNLVFLLYACRFLSRGGGMNLATWLSKAAAEEQTSVLLLILKVNLNPLVNILHCFNWHITEYSETLWLTVLQVLCHLPLHKAIPMHISAILQSVNKLRFYRTSGVIYIFLAQCPSSLTLICLQYSPLSLGVY